MNDKRLGKDGQPVEDSPVNQKAIERKAREVSEREKAASDALKPWTRERVQEELARSTDDPKSACNLHGANLSGLDLSGLDFSRSNLSAAILAKANLTGCRMVDANLSYADLSGALLEGSNAVGANLHGACLCGSKVGKTHFMMANLAQCCIEGADGFDIEERQLTAAEVKRAGYHKAEGIRVVLVHDDQGEGNAKAIYFGELLQKANVDGMSKTCRRRTK